MVCLGMSSVTKLYESHITHALSYSQVAIARSFFLLAFACGLMFIRTGEIHQVQICNFVVEGLFLHCVVNGFFDSYSYNLDIPW